jgi:hypothetical protein
VDVLHTLQAAQEPGELAERLGRLVRLVDPELERGRDGVFAQALQEGFLPPQLPFECLQGLLLGRVGHPLHGALGLDASLEEGQLLGGDAVLQEDRDLELLLPFAHQGTQIPRDDEEDAHDDEGHGDGSDGGESDPSAAPDARHRVLEDVPEAFHLPRGGYQATRHWRTEVPRCPIA